MRIEILLRALGACLISVICLTAGAMAQPQPVPNLRDRALDEASYVALAREWRAYIDKHGETADALVNLGRAERYIGDGMEAARIAGKRAVELEPDNPRAMDFYATILAVSGSERETAQAVRLLERCRAIAPDYGDALITLAAAYLHSGALTKARDVSKAIYDRRIIARPLQDFAYNMLIGLPEGAILVTNGDDDTFPPLALQAGMNLRTDVVVVNRHLLNAPAYADSLSREHVMLRLGAGPRAQAGETETDASRAIIGRWLAERKAPLYFAATVDMDDLDLGIKPVFEGLCLRATGQGLTPEQAGRLILEQYRLDSATDWDFGWDLAPTASRMIAASYVASLGNVAMRDGVSRDTRCRLLGKAASIAEFHKLDVQAHNVKALLKKCETE